jgi:uncharacterized protein YrzB (UPF0473 family)
MYEEKKKLKIVEEDGTISEAEIIVAFRLNETNKEYVIYTFNEEDDKGNVTIYASAYEEVNGEKQLTGIATEEEWTKIKEILKALAKV